MASVGPRTSQVKNIEAIDDLDTMYKTMEALGLPTREHKSIESMKSSVKKLLEVSVMKSSVKAWKSKYQSSRIDNWLCRNIRESLRRIADVSLVHEEEA